MKIIPNLKYGVERHIKLNWADLRYLNLRIEAMDMEDDIEDIIFPIVNSHARKIG